MRAAQPIEVIIGSGSREAAVLALIWLSAVGSALAWLAAHGDWPLAVRGVAAVALAFGGTAGWYAGRPMRGRLAWDGEHWRWRGADSGNAAAAPGLRIAIDGASWILLRDDAGRWCVLVRREVGVLWHGLRLALHSDWPAERGGAMP